MKSPPLAALHEPRNRRALLIGTKAETAAELCRKGAPSSSGSGCSYSHRETRKPHLHLGLYTVPHCHVGPLRSSTWVLTQTEPSSANGHAEVLIQPRPDLGLALSHPLRLKGYISGPYSTQTSAQMHWSSFWGRFSDSPTISLMAAVGPESQRRGINLSSHLLASQRLMPGQGQMERATLQAMQRHAGEWRAGSRRDAAMARPNPLLGKRL